MVEAFLNVFATEVSWDSSTNISLQLWDVAGHERFGTMTRVYYRYAIAAIIVFDVSRPATFEAVAKWRDDVNSKVVLPNGEQIPILLLANKCDLGEVDGEKLDAFVRAHNMIGWLATSAQDNVNVDSAMKFLIGKILEVSQRVKLDNPKLPSHNAAKLSVMAPDGGPVSDRSSAASQRKQDGSSNGGGGGCDC